MIKGVIFDFNGTLFFDTHIHNEAWDIFLERHALKMTHDEKNQKIHGKNNPQIFSSLFPDQLTDGDVEKLSVEKETIYQSLCLEHKMELASGAEDLMQFLLDKNIPFTIATASDLYNLQFYFKHLGLGRYFDLDRIVYNDGTISSKPNPQVFLKAMKHLNIKAHETLIFEDSAAGILAAKNSGAKEVIVVKSTSDDPHTQEHQVIQSFTEVDRSIFVHP